MRFRIMAFFAIFLLLTSVLADAGMDLRWKPMDKDTGGRMQTPGSVWRDPYLGMEFVWVPGGCFEMGCGSWTRSCDDDEYPVHEVCVDGFWMGRYEVTNEQFVRFLNEVSEGIRVDDDDVHYQREIIFDWRCDGCGDWKHGINWTGGNFRLVNSKENHPTVLVTWYGAKAFAKWLSEKTGYKFRLPTEAEWEYACRSAGKKVKHATSTGAISHDLANYAGTGGRDRWRCTSPVGSFPANRLGLYDMSGNVWEWCEDWYDKYYSRSPKNNPRGSSGGTYRVLRGGSCYYDRGLRCANRNRDLPVYRYDLIGFRLVCVDVRQ